jgi:hypothetical protein
VKVVSTSGGKLGLSIRDVDQATGRDLLDLEKIRVAQGTAGAAGVVAGGAGLPSGLSGISGIKVNPKDFEETTKRCSWCSCMCGNSGDCNALSEGCAESTLRGPLTAAGSGPVDAGGGGSSAVDAISCGVEHDML